MRGWWLSSPPFQADRDAALNVRQRILHLLACQHITGGLYRTRPKGLCKVSLEGRTRNFTGLDSPYEAPIGADLVLGTTRVNLNKATAQVCERVLRHCRTR